LDNTKEEKNKETKKSSINIDNEADLEKIEADEKIDELEILRQSFEGKKVEAENYYDQLLRLRADFDNYRKRVEKEFKEVSKYGKSDIIVKLLPVVDNFEKAIATMESVKENKSIIEGISLIYRDLLDTMGKEGLKKIESAGKPFDPNLHHAIMMKDTESGEEGMVIEEMQAGYTFEDRVIRPAMVVVTKHAEAKNTENIDEDADSDRVKKGD